MSTAPPKFKPAGEVHKAYISRTPPPFIRQRKYTGRRAQGIRYEKKVHRHLAELFPDSYLASPWIHFLADGKWRWCQPDGLVIDLDNGRIICVEVKYSHTAEAWWQVERLYLPVLRHCFDPAIWAFERCEVVRWYDPAISFPEPVELSAEVDRVGDKFRVHICRL